MMFVFCRIKREFYEKFRDNDLTLMRAKQAQVHIELMFFGLSLILLSCPAVCRDPSYLNGVDFKNCDVS
jgi:hypothetical protein